MNAGFVQTGNGKMMFFTYGLSMVMLSAVVQSAEEHETSMPGRGCGEVLAFVADYVERNYAGFEDKAGGADRPRYRQRKAEIRSRANDAPADAQCHELLLEYVLFFEDPHLQVSYRPDPAALAGQDTGPGDWPARQVWEPEMRGYLERAGSDLSPIEGIWAFVNVDYRVAILPDESTDGRYDAVVLEADGVSWLPGQIKATFERTGAREYRVDYYMGDRSLREETARLRGGLLVFSGVPSWARVYPDNTSQYDPDRYRAFERNSELGIRPLDPNTLLVRLPDFGPTVQARIDAMIEANWDQLTNARNLIIDVRGNPGGSTASYASLQPLLYTRPIVTPGISHYATDDNIRSIETFLEEVELTEDLQGKIRGLVAAMRAHRGGFVPIPDDILKFERELPYPERVAVLADRRCVSSCETFVWSALQSDKVTVFGENTAGFLDYGDVVPVQTPGPAFQLYNPTARSNRVLQGEPLDNVGIEPDVRVPEEVLYWVDWVHRQLTNL